MTVIAHEPAYANLADHLVRFSEVGFPRGIPQPAEPWSPLVKAATQYEARVVQAAYAYLRGDPIAVTALDRPEGLKSGLDGFAVRDANDENYRKRLSEYVGMISHIADLTRECVMTLGNPFAAQAL